MIGFPFRNKKATYEYLMKGMKDAQTKDGFEFPAEYMFKETPDEAGEADPIETTFAEMDRWGVDKGLFGLSDTSIEAKKRYPNRVYFSTEIDPNDIMGVVRKIKQAKDDHDLKAVTCFPAGTFPQVAVNDPQMYPVYATCCELDIPIIVNAGVAGPRLPTLCQHVELFDIVCYDFPELRIVMRHGAEPWEKLAMKLMLKWPGLHYMPSAFAPKYYPTDIIDYANSRGADKVMYAGYYPAGLTLERIFTEMRDVPLKDEVWPKFLRENAIRVFKLDD
ncbi:MAG: amidohydrolase family protein [Acidimicrobiales bacterium]|nr:amidohydrolase family protein [Acidimicrobiales bacterium]